MQYIYTLNEDNELVGFTEYTGESLQDNQTLIPIVQGLYNPTFDKERQVWINGKVKEEEVVEKTEEELLQEQIEASKHKVITEFELRKMFAEQNKKTMRLMMMMAKK